MNILSYVIRKKLLSAIFIILALITLTIIYLYNQQSDCNNCNLILISDDTLRADHMGLYGYSKDTTPNIDSWAKNATVYTNMRTENPTTYPSFSVLMTGKSVFDSKIFDNSTSNNESGISPYLIPIAKNTSTLAELLKKNGYLTAAFINTPSLDAKLTNINKGFDIYINEPEKSWYAGPPNEKYKSYLTSMQALDWLAKNKTKKVFLWIHFMESHSPYMPINEFKCKFGKEYCQEIYKKTLGEWDKERKKLETCQQQELPKNEIELFQTLYDGAIASSDKLFGLIIDKIKNLRLDKNSIIVFYGDHGEGFDHNYYFMHAHELYDSHIKIPFIINTPNEKKLTISNNLQNSSILPTLLKLLRIKTAAPSFLQFINSIFNKEDYSYYGNSYRTKFAVLKGNYKYIYTIPYNSCLYKGQTGELYDLQKDPKELINLYNKKAAISKDLKNALLKFLKENKLPTTVVERQQKEDNLYSTGSADVVEKLKSLGY